MLSPGLAATVGLLCVPLFCVREAGAQSPSFDVASLKPVQLTPGTDTYRANLGTIQHGELTMTNVTLADILRFAFSITNDDQISGPDWIRNKAIRFDILAKAPAGTPTSQILPMLLTLLLERFHLAYHRERKMLSFLALEVGKNGSKLHEAQEGTITAANQFFIGAIVSNRVTMQMLTTVLSRFLREPILDMTGLKGYYEVKLEWVPESGQLGAPAADAAPGPTIFTAVQNQLGLTLKPQKRRMDAIVVDHAEKVPVEN
jgi:uncharacterized protein (TIGR03435 family)